MAENNIKIPFNIPLVIGNELSFISDAISNRKISGDGEYTKKCCQFMEQRYNIKKVLLTTSCSTALDMSSILIEIKAGDEVILPSYTFTSTANSFLIRGANLKFVDIREDTLNIDENKIEKAINNKTKAIVLVHYAGVSCEMKKIQEIAKKNNIFIIEDAAHAIESKYNNKYLGTIGDLGCYSFHETKNLTCGEGGAILINNSQFIEKAEIIREKGTNRSKFYRGEVDKYTWVDIGSSFLPSEILSAFLYAQLENANIIIKKRINSWNYYYSAFEELEKSGLLRRPIIPANCKHNGHLFYILLKDEKSRDDLISYLKQKGILAVFHYLPLHLSPIGLKLGYSKGMLPKTEDLASRLLRLPLFYGITKDEQDYIFNNIYEYFLNKKF
jgi:dTDP-4-amino-4,6-dideoxygalactose transaminase